MSEQNRKAATMKIGQNIDYAKVATRLMEFHGDNKQCSIETQAEFKEGYVIFSAKVTCPRGVFTGHSLGKAGGQKAFEKQETIAVGRALAFAGYSSSGEIASFEEMTAWVDDINGRVTTASINDLKKQWVAAKQMDQADRKEMAEAFSGYVEETTGRHFNASDFRQWTPDDMAVCLAGLEMGVDA